MDQTGYEAGFDISGSDADPMDRTGASRGHTYIGRQADPIWAHFNKRKLPVDRALNLKHISRLNTRAVALKLLASLRS